MRLSRSSQGIARHDALRPHARRIRDSRDQEVVEKGMDLQKDVKPEGGASGHAASVPPANDEAVRKRGKQAKGGPGSSISGLTRGPGSVPEAGELSREDYEKL